MTSATKFAVIETGGKQHHVIAGQRIVVGRLAGKAGESVTLDKVILIGQGEAADMRLGSPFVKQAKVQARIVAQERSRKTVIFKKRRRKGYTKKQGHRQDQTRLVIESIEG